MTDSPRQLMETTRTLYPIRFRTRLQLGVLFAAILLMLGRGTGHQGMAAFGDERSVTALAVANVAAKVNVEANAAAIRLQPAGGIEDIKARRARVLKLFVEELISIQPGVGQFPKEFRFGGKTSDTDAAPRVVEMKEPFSIAKYEVTQDLWGVVMQNNPSKWKGPLNSAEMFTPKQAREFCIRLTDELHAAGLLAKDMEVRLPTELEWEYCCRAGTETEYSFGDSAAEPGDAAGKTSLFDQYGWHTGNAAGNDPPVGAKKPNPWGLYDVHGYLWEICSDEWTAAAKPAAGKPVSAPSAAAATVVVDEPATAGADPAPDSAASKTDSKPSNGEQCVIRGGSWKDKVDQCRSSSRRAFGRDAADDAVGLRCVCAKIR